MPDLPGKFLLSFNFQLENWMIECGTFLAASFVLLCPGSGACTALCRGAWAWRHLPNSKCSYIAWKSHWDDGRTSVKCGTLLGGFTLVCVLADHITEGQIGLNKWILFILSTHGIPMRCLCMLCTVKSTPCSFFFQNFLLQIMFKN